MVLLQNILGWPLSNIQNVMYKSRILIVCIFTLKEFFQIFIDFNSIAQGRKGFHCGGVLINKDYVVTGKWIENR